MYEYSGQPGAGLHPANLEETLGVIKQVIGMPGDGLHVNTAKQHVDNTNSYTSLDAQYTPALIQLLNGVGAYSPMANFYAVGHTEGTITVQFQGNVAVLRYLSVPSAQTFYVNFVPEPVPAPTIDADILKAFVAWLNADQRIALARQLKEAGVIIQ